MDRRLFLRIVALGGLGAAVGGRDARALKLVECATDGEDTACRRIAEHEETLRRMDQMLVDRGISDPAERKALLAAAACPLCGLPLVATADGAF
jgi:hypothetical protein